MTTTDLYETECALWMNDPEIYHDRFRNDGCWWRRWAASCTTLRCRSILAIGSQRKSHGIDVRLPHRMGGPPRLTSETIASVLSNGSGRCCWTHRSHAS
jgi:hypothetical protein